LAASVFYLISYFALAGAVYAFPKTVQGADGACGRQNAFLWLPVSLLLAECWLSVAAGLLSLLQMPVSLLSMGFSCIVPAALLFYLKRNKPGQYFRLRPIDAVFGALLLALVLAIFYIRFFTANPIIFATIDPAERLGNAMNIAVAKSVISHFPNQYFIQLTGSLFIQSAQPFFPGVLPFRFFELKDIFNLWFTGALFYAGASLYMRSRFSKGIAFLLSFAFALGYPWMGQLFGFVYPGVAVNLILLVLIVMTLLAQGRLARVPAYLAVSLGCFGAGVCYTLFIPPLFLTAFLCVALYEFRIRKDRQNKQAGGNMALHGQNRGVFLARLALTEFCVFIIPAAWAFANAMVLGRGGEFNLGNSITAEGAIYRNLFTDFLPYAPFALWLLWRAAKKKQWSFPIVFALLFALYQIGMFALMMAWRISTYYYYKLNYATWFVLVLLAILAVDELTAHARAKRFVTVYFVCWLLVAAFGISGADYKLDALRPMSNPQPGADVSFRVYSTNLLYFTPPGVYNVENYGWDFIDLCTQARKLAGPPDEEHRIGIVTGNSPRDGLWKDALTSQMLVPQPTAEPGDKNGLWIVLYDSDAYRNGKTYYDGLAPLFENARGFVARPE
jgi:hypothetical protein